MIAGSWDDDLDFVNWIIDEISSSGYRVVYRPHPREMDNERLKKIHCDVFIMPQVSLEVIFNAMKLKPACLVSEYSSTMAYSELYFGVRAISYRNIEQHLNIKKDREYLQSYIDAFREIMHFPTDIDELLKLLPEYNKKEN